MRLRRSGRRTIVALAATVAAVGGLLAGCSSSGSSSGSLTLYSDNPGWKPGFIAAGKEIAKSTGRDLAPVGLPSTANYRQVVQASLSTNKPGDIVKWWSGKVLTQLAAGGQLTDLSTQWDAAVKKGWLDDSLRPYYSYQGKVYGLPIYQSYWVVFYDKPTFAKYGITPPTTYKEFTDAAAKLKANGVVPIGTGQADQWTSFIPYQSLVGSISSDFYTKLTENKASFADPVSRQALTTWKGWIQDGWTTPPDTKLQDVPPKMKAGKVAMLPIGTWNAGGMNTTARMKPGVDYGAFLMPQQNPADPQTVFAEGGAWVVPTKAPDHAAAVKQLGHWLDPSVQRKWSDFIGDASANPTVTPSNPVIKDLAKQIAATKPTILNRYYESFPPNLVQDSTNVLDGFMVKPDVDSTISSLRDAEKKDWGAWQYK